MNQSIRRTVAGTAALLAASPLVFGAGFQLAERSATGLGRSFPGKAAIGDVSSTF